MTTRNVRIGILFGATALGVLYLLGERIKPASGFVPQQGDKTSEVRFPKVTAANLEKKLYNLPQDFEGERNLVLIAFTREQQANVDTWFVGAKPILTQTKGLEAYELPVLSTGNAGFRAFLDNAMVNGIPDKTQRERTITLYLDKKAFRTALGLSDEKRIYALLVNKAGDVLWRAGGRFTKESGESLRRALTKPVASPASLVR